MSDVAAGAGAGTGARVAARAAGGFARDHAVTALIFGVAAFAWFGWGQAQPPAGWTIPLSVGSAAGAVVAVLAGIRLSRLRSGPSAMEDPRVRRGYFRTVGAEVVAIAVGCVVLTATGQALYIAAWVLLVVGVHFIPLGRVFRDVSLAYSGAALIAVAIAAAIAGAATGVTPSTVAGAGGGIVLFAFAVVSLAGAAGRLGLPAWPAQTADTPASPAEAARAGQPNA
jgi:hypothetical protein